MRRTAVSVAALVAMTGLPAPAHAATEALASRPFFQLPFACGTKVFTDSAGSHAGYVDKALDMYPNTGNPYSGGYSADGWEVRPAVGGTVRYLSGSTTNTMYVEHNSTWRTMYAHMKNRVKNGSKVTRSTVIGRIGSVGTGKPHLHYEQQQKVNGTWQLVKPYFNGKNRSLGSGGRQILTSHSCTHPKPTVWCRYRAEKAVNKRSWAGTKYESEGKLTKGTVYVFGYNGYRKPGSTVWRRLKSSGGADGQGPFVSGNHLKYLGGGTSCPT
ncbi:M23 family metallopeptidase [Nonomuraea harbinensis]|uniref:M23 family metallopeptidase n=1 Tax=Nonomuraea harbinensis TaxID=1286938 RepID=A0ABW1C4S9_9ACTN|nr:M23 family metallopeptidase [Nonomuraea harbinensis]